MPGADDTFAYAINDHGVIVGNAGSATDGFIYSDGKFVTVPPPSYLGQAHFYAINNTGEIAVFEGATYKDGNYNAHLGFSFYGINDRGQLSGVGHIGTSHAVGIFDPNGDFTPIMYPSAIPDPRYTDPHGINSRGQLVGQYGDSNGRTRGFLYSDGVYTPIDFPGAFLTQPMAINDKGQIVGHYRLRGR